MSADIDDMRANLMARSEEQKGNQLFMLIGAGIVALGLIGGIIWGMMPSKPPVQYAVAASTETKVEPVRTVTAKEAKYTNAERRAQIDLYRQINHGLMRCSRREEFKNVAALREGWLQRNKPRYNAWQKALKLKVLDGKSSDIEIMAGSMTGQLQNDTRTIMEEISADFQSFDEASVKRSTNDCAQLRAKVQMGKAELKPFPG